MRIPFIAGNWKMFKTKADAVKFAEEFKSLYKGTDIQAAICAPFTDLEALAEIFKGTDIKIGAQNVHFADEGAYTGEISVSMLEEIGVDFCIVGHSERRQYFKEDNEMVNRKIRKAIEHNIIPIICCGETLEEREAGITLTLIKKQIVSALKYVSPENAQRCIIAYEPIWAIGTGRVATTQQAQEVCCSIRGIIRDIYGTQIADAIRILYGGSVNAGNALQLFSEPDIDGGLVGGASLKPEFSKIVNYQ